MSDTEYHESDYIPPRVAVVIGSLLRTPREVGHSVQFSDLFSSVQEDRRAYFDGLSAVPIIFGSLFFAWAFVTILLKCKGEEVGCASGRAFVRPPSFDEDDNEDAEDENLGKDEDLASTSSSSNGESIGTSSIKPLFTGPGGAVIKHSDSDVNEQHKESCCQKLAICMRRRKERKEARAKTRVNKRECSTRLSFLFFALIALVCAPLCIVLTFGPLREVATTESPTSLFVNIENVVQTMALSLETIQSLSLEAVELIDTVPTDLDAVCPLVNITNFEATIGVDITEIVETIIDQQNNLEVELVAELATKQSYVNGMVERMATFETISEETENYLWILPALLLTVICLTVIAVAGVIMAWKGTSGSRFQRLLSYGVLPILILTSFASWAVVMAFAFSTMVGTDICMSGSSYGSPDQTIHEILASAGNATEGSLHQFVSTYAVDCELNDPSREISKIKLETQDHIDNIWREVSKIDSVGRVMAIERCGDNGEFSKMLSGARDLAMILTDIRRSLSRIEEATSCDYIVPIYKQVTEDIVCTKTLSASAYGFITFLVIWVCTMAMISMRASWLRNCEEEKIYHDDDEVAENMVVDEHEEYLAYISKYKHEWQEYEGFEEDRVVTPSHNNRRHFEYSSNHYYGDDNEEEIVFADSKYDEVSTLDDGTTAYYCCRECKEPQAQQTASSYCMECNPLQERHVVYQRRLTTREIMDHHDEDGVSYASGEISFASLSSQIKSDVLNPKSILVLPPPMNPDYKEKAEQEQLQDGNDGDKNEKSDSNHSKPGLDASMILQDLNQDGGEEVEVQLYDL